MTQVARPIEDLFFPLPTAENEAFESWRNELGENDRDLFIGIDAFLPNDVDFAESNLILGPTLPEDSVTYVCKLSVVETTSTADQGLTVRVRLAKDIASGNKVDALVELREEYTDDVTDRGKLIASNTFVNITDTFQEYSFVVTPTEAGNIQNFSDLSLRFVFTADLR